MTRFRNLSTRRKIAVVVLGSAALILAPRAGAQVLTVGEHEGFAQQGGAIGFAAGGNKVRLAINTGAARDAGLEINPRLLQLSQPAR